MGEHLIRYHVNTVFTTANGIPLSRDPTEWARVRVIDTYMISVSYLKGPAITHLETATYGRTE